MKAVFVVGTGRSGTHFTVRLLAGFENAHDPLGGTENVRVLKQIALAALEHRSLPKQVSHYYTSLFAKPQGVILDQHHPNLFFIDSLAEQFPDVVFLYPKRPTFQVVASMMRHRGVMHWYKDAKSWRRKLFRPLPYPNQFLGIDAAAELDRLPLHLKCAHRVLAHHEMFRRQQTKHPTAVRAVNYEALVTSPKEAFERIFAPEELAALGKFTLKETPNPASLSKYTDVLSDADVAEIAELEQNWSQT